MGSTDNLFWGVPFYLRWLDAWICKGKYCGVDFFAQDGRVLLVRLVPGLWRTFIDDSGQAHRIISLLLRDNRQLAPLGDSWEIR